MISRRIVESLRDHDSRLLCVSRQYNRLTAMSHRTGSRLEPDQIVSLIGVGGLVEFYRARDTKLKRDVALKVLPEAFLTDHDRLARFQQEAEVLASLNHSHIASIYGLHE